MLVYCTKNEQRKFEYLLEAMAYARKNNELGTLGNTLEDLALLNEQLKYSNADTEKYFLEALDIFEKNDYDSRHLISTYVNVATFYLDMQRIRKTLYYRDKVIQIKQERKLSNYETCRFGILQLKILLHYQKYKETIILADSLIENFANEHDKLAFAQIHLIAAQAKVEEKLFKEAKEHLRISLKNTENSKKKRIKSKELLIKIALYEKDYATAYSLRTEIFTNQSKFVEEQQSQLITEMKTKFETERKERENLELKLKALRAQMNPHFIFNSLNSIQNFVAKNDKEETIKYISKFARLMRQALSNSEEKNIFLEDELDFLENYLSLEKLRFKDAFDYEINCTKNMDTAFIQIPSMLIQPYVENAIVHGMKNKQNGGLIHISFWESDCATSLFCSITDNGEGISKVLNKTKKHKSLGTKITKERIKMLGNGKQVNAKFIDLKAEKNSGTRIEIEIPIV